MGSDIEDQCSMPRSKPDDHVTARDFHKKSKLSYTRDFLVCLAELNACKSLPAGFDRSILREFDVHSTPLLPRYNDSDAGRFQSSPSNSPWRNPQQGLLGSGAFAKVYRGAAEISVTVVQSSGINLLKRSSEPYRPPHLCKAKDYSDRQSKDFYNGQTFGSSDDISQERAEQEKQRRDSFALMRKEQEMAAQAKQNIISDEHMENQDVAIFQDDSGVGEKVANKYRKYKESQPCAVQEGYPENPVLCSSNSTHQFPEAGILSCECLEEAILSEINGQYSTQNNLIHGRSTYDVQDSQSSCSNNNAASQHFLSFLQNRVDLADPAESSKLNMLSMDKPHFCEAGKGNQRNKLGRVYMNNSEKNLPEPVSRTDVHDLQSTELSGTQKYLTHRSKEDNEREFNIPLPVGDNWFIPFAAKSGSIGDVDMFSTFVKQTDVTKRDSNLSVSSIQEGLDLQGWPESKHNSPISFDELEICLPEEDSLITADDCAQGLDIQGWPESKHNFPIGFDDLEICLPDEDSLITAEDFIFPQDSMPMAARDTSSNERPADCDVAVTDERFDLASLKTPTLSHGSHDLVSSDTSVKSLFLQQQPRHHHSQLKTEKVSSDGN